MTRTIALSLALLGLAACGQDGAAPRSPHASQASRAAPQDLAPSAPASAPAPDFERWIAQGDSGAPTAVAATRRADNESADRLWVRCDWSNGPLLSHVSYNLSVLPDAEIGRAVDLAGGRDLAASTRITVEGPQRRVFRPVRVSIGRPQTEDIARVDNLHEVVARFDMSDEPRKPGQLAPADDAFLRALASTTSVRIEIGLEAGRQLSSSFPGRGAQKALEAARCSP